MSSAVAGIQAFANPSNTPENSAGCDTATDRAGKGVEGNKPGPRLGGCARFSHGDSDACRRSRRDKHRQGRKHTQRESLARRAPLESTFDKGEDFLL